ncbi:MAG: efflux RND transporter permease subunit, partial [Planctomycetes bacterium]|nr:efflux RND transporter permease subunit [Planctomycetota bacterium]
MLNAILAWSLRYRSLVLITGLVVAGVGLWSATDMPIDVLPDLNRPTVTIMTEAHGMIPEDVEQLVTWPIEQVVNGATHVIRVRSQSGVGLSVVNVEFDWGSDLYRCRQIVAEKLQLAMAQLPPGAQPVMTPISSIMGQIQLIGFRLPTAGEGVPHADELRAWIDRVVRPRLLSISGIAQVVAIGGQPRELQVAVDPNALRAFDVTLSEVAEAVERANVSMTGGVLEIGAKGPLVSVPGRVRAEDDLTRAVVDAER